VERISVSHASIARPLTVAWLCDMHFGPFIHAGSVAAWVDATLDLAPDLVLLGGDLVDQHAPDDVSPLVAQLRRLRAPLGVYSVLGNHEGARFGRGPALEAFVADLDKAGITTLVNRGVAVRDDLYLAGIDAAGGGFGRIGRALAQRPPATACLVAAHKPDVLPLMPADVELTLCGHTHGGQVRLPGIGPVLFDSQLSRDYSSGWYRSPSLGYVSRGLGVGHVPLRIACPAELTLATLTPA
jgi:predicted MPP superfamily phosphohydrolase